MKKIVLDILCIPEEKLKIQKNASFFRCILIYAGSCLFIVRKKSQLFQSLQKNYNLIYCIILCQKMQEQI